MKGGDQEFAERIWKLCPVAEPVKWLSYLAISYSTEIDATRASTGAQQPLSSEPLDDLREMSDAANMTTSPAWMRPWFTHRQELLRGH